MSSLNLTHSEAVNSTQANAVELEIEASRLIAMAAGVRVVMMLAGICPGATVILIHMGDNDPALGIAEGIAIAVVGGLVGYFLGNVARTFLKVFALRALK